MTEENYPVLVRFFSVSVTGINFTTGRITEKTARSFSFVNAWWFVNGDHEFTEKDSMIIFTSKRVYDELAKPRRFMPHWVEGSGWRCANDLSEETRHALLSAAMRMNFRTRYFQCQ